MQIRRNSKLNCFNSVAIGYPVGLILENDKGGSTQQWASNGDLNLQNIVFAQMGIIGSDKNKSFCDMYSNDGTEVDSTNVSFSRTFFLSQTGNKYYDSVNDLMLKQPNSLKTSPSYAPLSGSPLLNAASFNHSLLSDFTKVTYIGAFAGESDNWMEGWTNFDPQNTAY